jgi:hypothetical protein
VFRIRIIRLNHAFLLMRFTGQGFVQHSRIGAVQAQWLRPCSHTPARPTSRLGGAAQVQTITITNPRMLFGFDFPSAFLLIGSLAWPSHGCKRELPLFCFVQTGEGMGKFARESGDDFTPEEYDSRAFLRGLNSGLELLSGSHGARDLLHRES